MEGQEHVDLGDEARRRVAGLGPNVGIRSVILTSKR